jgi:ankyrin repeat domain-containing protein 50
MEKLEKLPPKLDVLYDEALKRIDMQAEEHAALAKRVLLWVTYACRPLTVRDMKYAVASKPGSNDIVPESLMVSVCCGLVVVVGHRFRLVRQSSFYFWRRSLAHLTIDYTALDAVRRVFDRWEPSPHCLITEFCVDQLVAWGVPNGQYSMLDTRPFPRRYAYESWHIHAQQSIQLPAQRNARPVVSLLSFLAKCEAFPVWDAPRPFRWKDDALTAPIHLVAFYHLPTLLPLIDIGVNVLTEMGRSALSLAVSRNDSAMVKLLLKLDGIDVNTRGIDRNTPLMLAEKWGFEDVAAILRLDHRTEIANWILQPLCLDHRTEVGDWILQPAKFPSKFVEPSLLDVIDAPRHTWW